MPRKKDMGYAKKRESPCSKVHERQKIDKCPKNKTMGT
jgi:hypothetical protein